LNDTISWGWPLRDWLVKIRGTTRVWSIFVSVDRSINEIYGTVKSANLVTLLRQNNFFLRKIFR
jgi:hypothetical protein